MTDLQDALLRVANLKRTLAIAREVQANAFDLSLVSDVVQSLIRQLQEAELEAAKLIGARGTTLGDGYISVKHSDRRDRIRPAFHYRHRHAMELVQ